MRVFSRCSPRGPLRPAAFRFARVTSVLAIAMVGVLAPRSSSLKAADSRAGRAEQPAPPLTPQQKAEFIRSYEALPKVNVPLDPGGAKVLVLKFNDYQCPPCRQSFYEYKAILSKYVGSGRVKYVLKHFPLERECNAAVGGDLHHAACEAAAAVVMAQAKGTSDKLEEWLFANQASLTPDAVKKAAASVAGVGDFDAQYSRALTLVRTDAGLGALLGAKSTPTFFINGRVIAGMLPPNLFELAIEYELGGRGSVGSAGSEGSRFTGSAGTQNPVNPLNP
jgi:protein-disulfide isomerase